MNANVTGRLKYVAPVIDSATQAVRTVFALDNRDQKLPAGFPAQLDSHSLTQGKSLVGSP